jgi:nucleoside-diphosphate-sugar epimerase
LPDAERIRREQPAIRSLAPFDLATPSFDAIRMEGVDVVLHSAAVIHVHRTADWYRVNTQGTAAFARAARAAGVKRFVFISSNAAGGRSRSRDLLMSESDPATPMSHYGRSKWRAEQALMQLHVPGKFEVVILRPSMFYGPPVPLRHIEIYQRIVNGKMPMIGDGGYARSITYIDSLVQAARLAMTLPAASGQTYYIVDAKPYSTKQISDAMAAALGVTPRYFQLPKVVAPTAYALDRALAAMGIYWQNLHLVGEADWHVGISPAKAIAQLGYHPTVDLEEGMQRAVEWCRKNGSLGGGVAYRA